MKQGRTLTELAMELERQAASKRDFISDTRNMYMFGGKGLSIQTNGDRESFDLTPHAHGQIAARLDIPKRYYDTMKASAPNLLNLNVNHWFKEKPEKRMVRTMDKTARAFLSNRYRRLDNLDVAESTLPIFGDMQVDLVSCNVTDQKLYLKALFPRIQQEVTVGDVIQSGVVISNSEIGLGALSVQALVFRLVCKNGMISADASMRKYHVGRLNESEGMLDMLQDDTLQADDRAFMLKLRDTVKATASEAGFKLIIDRFREATGVKIDDPVGTVEMAQKKWGMNDTDGKGILRHLIEGGDLSKYGLANAVSRYSQDVEDYDRATEFEGLSGHVIDLKPGEWKELSAAA